MEPRILAIIPAYNEEANIVSTVEDLRQNAPGVDLVVINDGSRDATGDICRERGYNCISLPVNLGLAGGFQTGMKYALRHGYDYAVQFDADGQHSAAYVLPMVRHAQETGSNIVIGSRFCAQKKPFSARMVGSALITTMIPLFANELDYSPEPDTIALVARNGAKVSEVQVEMRDRVAGESYLNFTKSISYMLRVCFSILFVQWFRKDPS